MTEELISELCFRCLSELILNFKNRILFDRCYLAGGVFGGRDSPLLGKKRDRLGEGSVHTAGSTTAANETVDEQLRRGGNKNEGRG